MNRLPFARRSALAAMAGAAALTLVGCGGDAGPTAVDDPSTPTRAAGGGVSGSSGSAATPAGLDPSLAQWPSGCDSRAMASIDYGRLPRGWKTPEEAVAHSPAGDIPTGVLTMAPDAGKGPAQVWVVDPDSNEIEAQVSVFQGPDGWYVDGVMTCS
jgi:hypothetical protein